MKAYTDLEQSKVLEEILSHETADMCYPYDRHLNKMYGDIPYVTSYKRFNEDTDFPCWSLAALYALLPERTDISKAYSEDCGTIVYWCWTVVYESEDECGTVTETNNYDNPIDACVEMILKLNELKML